jgi:hypothetical protein
MPPNKREFRIPSDQRAATRFVQYTRIHDGKETLGHKSGTCASRRKAYARVNVHHGNLVARYVGDFTFISSEASRILIDRGRLFICELHPFRQYQGKQARFHRGAGTYQIAAAAKWLRLVFHSATMVHISLIFRLLSRPRVRQALQIDCE